MSVKAARPARSRAAGAAVVGVEVRPRVARRVPLPLRRRLLRSTRRALLALGLDAAEVALCLVDDAEMRELNLAYAGEDHATDVLSFSQREGQGPARAGGADPRGVILLGDIVVSIDTAARQARDGGRRLFPELLHLVVHGLVHLYGLDHARPAEEARMFGLEARVRAEVLRAGPARRLAGLPRPSRQPRQRA